MIDKPRKEDQWDLLNNGIRQLKKGESINVVIEDRVYKVEYLHEKDKIIFLK